MIDILKVDHIGIRVREKERSIRFYESLGFEFLSDVGFEDGHPVMMRNPAGIVLNLLGTTSEARDENILMDVEQRYAGYTHIALRVDSITAAEKHFDELGYVITGRMSFKGMHALFIRDPDRNVIEFDQYEGDDPATRAIPHTH